MSPVPVFTPKPGRSGGAPRDPQAQGEVGWHPSPGSESSYTLCLYEDDHGTRSPVYRSASHVEAFLAGRQVQAGERDLSRRPVFDVRYYTVHHLQLENPRSIA